MHLSTLFTAVAFAGWSSAAPAPAKQTMQRWPEESWDRSESTTWVTVTPASCFQKPTMPPPPPPPPTWSVWTPKPHISLTTSDTTSTTTIKPTPIRWTAPSPHKSCSNTDSCSPKVWTSSSYHKTCTHTDSCSPKIWESTEYIPSPYVWTPTPTVTYEQSVTPAWWGTTIASFVSTKSATTTATPSTEISTWTPPAATSAALTTPIKVVEHKSSTLPVWTSPVDTTPTWSASKTSSTSSHKYTHTDPTRVWSASSSSSSSSAPPLAIATLNAGTATYGGVSGSMAILAALVGLAAW